MKYTIKGNLVYATMNSRYSKTRETNVLIASSIESMRKMVGKHIKEELAKNYTVSWNNDTKYEVMMYQEKDYSNYDEFDSEFITITNYTFVKLSTKRHRNIIRSEKTRRNPKYVYNPRCQFCHKKTTKLYNQTLLDNAKTLKKVCQKCNKDTNKMRKIVQEMGIKIN